MTGKIRRHIVFEGRVQGVGFRYRSYHLAQQLTLTGWVRNDYDGTVEMEVQGLEEMIDRMVSSLTLGSYIQIEKMRVKKLPIEEEERSFRIRE